MEEPLNLTIKKKPVAVVAPTSVHPTNNNHPDVPSIETSKYDDHPQDLSLRKRNNDGFTNNNLKEDALYKRVNETKDNYSKKCFMDSIREQELKSNIMNTVYKGNNLYDGYDSKNLTASENIYSMINYLAEHKFLAAWYMNSVLGGNFPFASNPFQQGIPPNHPNNNSILNNLLDKKVTNEEKPVLTFDTLIKNKVTSDNVYDSPGNDFYTSSTRYLHPKQIPFLLFHHNFHINVWY